MPAGDNEKLFKDLIDNKFGSNLLNGKKRFENNNKVNISVDESIIIDGRTILIEIDSGNMAKLIVGQYVLLNQLYTDCKENTTFLVIHYYKDYNKERTIKNLNLIQDINPDIKWIPFKVYHITEFKEMVNSANNLTELFKPHT